LLRISGNLEAFGDQETSQDLRILSIKSLKKLVKPNHPIDY